MAEQFRLGTGVHTALLSPDPATACPLDSEIFSPSHLQLFKASTDCMCLPTIPVIISKTFCLSNPGYGKERNCEALADQTLLWLGILTSNPLLSTPSC